MQVTWQMVKPESLQITPKITFAEAKQTESLVDSTLTGGRKLRPIIHNALITCASQALLHHASIQSEAKFISF
jgi:hypothetical protein